MIIDSNELIAYCESCADVSKNLHETVMTKIGKGESETSAIGAMAFFMQRESMYRYEIPSLIKSYIGESGKAMRDSIYKTSLLRAQIDQLTAERNAAVADMKHDDNCDVCKHGQADTPGCEMECDGCTLNCACKDCRDASCFEWRGLRKESDNG